MNLVCGWIWRKIQIKFSELERFSIKQAAFSKQIRKFQFIFVNLKTSFVQLTILFINKFKQED
jgi:hypothetical protein